jgi:hypothetical protein
MIITISILAVVFFIASVYFAYRAYVLAGILADIQEYYESVEMTNRYMYEKILMAYENMQHIDSRGAFESDDEAGTTFELLNQVINDLKEEFDGTEEEK